MEIESYLGFKMSLHYQIDYDNDILYEDIDGIINERDAYKALNNHLTYNNSHSGMKMLTNLQSVTLQISTSCVIDLARKSCEYYNQYRGTKWAFITDSNYNYGIARMFASFTEGNSFTVKVFRDLKSAEHWLNS